MRRAACTSVSMITVLSAVLTPLVGSSMRMTSGWSANALATSRSFLSPWGSVRAARPSLSARPKSAATSSTAARTSRSRASAVNGRALRPRRASAATASVSPTLRPGKIVTSWNERAMPSRARRTGVAPTTSTPLNVTRPDVGTVSPVSTFISVVLPAPLGPMIETNSPAPTRRLTPSSAHVSP